MMQSSTKSPTITVFRLRSDRTMFGSYIPLACPGRVAGCKEDRSFKTHATTTNKTTITTVNGTASGAPGTEVASTNKSDYIYLTQSTGRALLVTRFPLDDLGATRALVGHITELMRTTNSVTLKCDLNAYLSNVSISRNLALDQCTTLSRKVPTMAAVREKRCGGSYIKFDDLLAMVASEKALLKRRSALESQGRVLPRLRLCGGGEDSINNGTSAWGTPPTSANGTSAWGIPNQQQQQQQQPPQAWGGTAGSNNANNNNNNNNNQPTSSQSQRQSSQSQDHNANKAPQQQQGSGSAQSGGGTPNPWNRNPTQQQQQQQQPQQPPGPNPNQQPPQQQQQQQQQLVMGNNGNVATKSQLEQLSHLREALFSQDGWGCQNVNQDTNWEVPGSPEPPKPEASGAAGGGNGGPNPQQAVTGWKPCNLNNGTELWEANLRNGGQPPPPQAPVQKTPWGPASNIGGTWGEDDESGEANVWNGAAGGNPPAAAPPAWGQNNPQMWPPGAPTGPNPAAVKKDNDWAGVGVIGNAGAAAVPPVVPGWDSRGAPVPAVNVPPGPIGQTNPIEAVREIRGDPRGISGRLAGNVGMWDQPNVPNLPTGAKLAQGSLPSVGGGANSQWNTPVPNKLPGGWDDSPSPMNNRPTLDDGPSGMWNQGQLSRQNSNVSSWKDMSDNVVRTQMPRTPLGGGGANLPLGPSVSRGVRLGGMNPGMKPDSSMWGQNQGLPMNGSWDDCAGAGGINNWDDKGAAGGNGPWNDFGQSNMWKQQGKPSVGGWPDPSDLMGGGSGGEWNMNKPPSKMSPVEIIRSSKQYRMLCENGFKKEDVELVLRTTNMNFDESLEILQRHNSAGDWRGRPDEHPGSAFEAPFSNRFPTGPGGGMPFSQNQNLLNNLPGVGGPNPNLAALNNLKYLSQGGGAGGHSSFGSQPGGGGGPNPMAAAAGAQQNPQAQPSTQHLRMLVQQIQMAVHAGFLNHQILNQPLAPQTLLLLNQLLTNIRQMQHIQNNLARSGGASGVSTVQLTMQINKHKSTISQLQQQIATQQAIYVKQQQQQQQPGGPHQQPPNVGLGGAADFLRQQDLVSLQSNFADMGMGKEPVTPTGGYPAAAAGGNSGGAGSGVTSQQSRLNQWKLPSLEKDGGGGANDLTDFSRAPGTTAKSTLSTASSNIGSLGLQDGTWSSGRSNLADGWPDQPTSAGGNDPDNKDWNSSQDNAAFSDLVPEFEPGKPWKGAQLKIDEDPSITPGSVARSPLSIATAKEADLFGGGVGKVSPSDSMGLGSSTWGKPGKNVWPDSITSTGAGGGGGGAGGSSADLWGNPMGKTTRGPPPGLGANKNANGWAGGPAGVAQRSGSGGNWPSGNGWGSSWLLLKNLTSQIDGATLRTLCMQHGPLQSLQLYPNHGLALCKYSSREEASKAQQALNNCPLGSTNIGAECPSEADAQTYLQQLGAPAVGGVGSSGSILPPSSSGPVTSVAQSWRQAPRNTGADTWGSGWPPAGGAGATGGSAGGLWAPLEGTTAGNPSNLNSFLPESLLGTDLN